MDRILTENFFKISSEIFDFLVRNYGFKPAFLEVNHSISFVYVIFMGKNLAVECIFDAKEKDISCKIAKVFNGQKTPDYEVDDTGARVRDYLTEILIRKGVRDIKFNKISENDSIEKMSFSILTDYAAMLKKYGQDILTDSPSVFS